MGRRGGVSICHTCTHDLPPFVVHVAAMELFRCVFFRKAEGEGRRRDRGKKETLTMGHAHGHAGPKPCSSCS